MEKSCEKLSNSYEIKLKVNFDIEIVALFLNLLIRSFSSSCFIL